MEVEELGEQEQPQVVLEQQTKVLLAEGTQVKPQYHTHQEVEVEQVLSVETVILLILIITLEVEMVEQV